MRLLDLPTPWNLDLQPFVATDLLEILEAADGKELVVRQPTAKHLELLHAGGWPPEVQLVLPASLFER